MKKEEFEELEEIRTEIRISRKIIMEIENEIREREKEKENKIRPMEEELNELFYRDLNDKGKRKRDGFTNQTLWKKELQKRHVPMQEKIDDIVSDFEVLKEKGQYEIRKNKIMVMDLIMEHTNKHAYYSLDHREE